MYYRGPLIFGVVLLSLILGAIFIFGGHGKKVPVNPNPIQPLASYATTNAQVSMTIDGPVNGDDAHRQVKITVSRDARDLDIIQGYSGNVVRNTPFYNTVDAYSVFLKAINNNGFLLQRKGTAANLDYNGQCALGERFIFTLAQDGQTLSQLWTSTCSSGSGNFVGLSQNLQTLFEAQITNYGDLTSDVDLGL